MILENATFSRAGFEELARRVALGEQPTETEINATLADACESPESLEQLADRFRQRRSIRARLISERATHDAYAKVRAKIEAANATLEAAVESHRQETENLQRESADLRRAMGESRATEQDLVATAPIQLQDALRDAQRQHDVANRRADVLRDEVVRFRGGRNPNDQARADRMERDLAQLELRLPELQQAAETAYRACVEW